MNEEMFQEWKESPLTQKVFKYLLDLCDDTANPIAERIKNGGIFSQEEQLKIATECVTLLRVTEITFEEIEQFYEDKKWTS